VGLVVNGLRERKKQATRQAISDAATELFMHKGFDNTSVADVAEAVGVSAQTVLNYFPTKTDLFFDEPHWYAGPAQAMREEWGLRTPSEAVFRWYLSDLQRRHAEGHLEELAVYLQTIDDSETLRRRRLDDFAAQSADLRSALDDASPAPQAPWVAALTAEILTSAIIVAESETARLSRQLNGTELLKAAQRAAKTIFKRASHAIAPSMNDARR
jgi:AcrR family transcriptional regulator